MTDAKTVKTCTKCLSEKDILDFGVDMQKRGGVSSHCKECKKIASNGHYSRNADYYKKRNQNFYANLSAEKKTQYRTTSNAKQITKDSQTRWRRENAGKVSAYSKKWMAKIPPEILSQKRKEYRKLNPEMFAKHSVKRRSSEKAASPQWLSNEDKKQMNLVYLKRDFINELTGVKHEVDHIYPIQGKDSCGLHVPWNLRIMTSTENRRKKNSLPSHA